MAIPMSTIDFATGTEVFVWSSESMNTPRRPSGILSVWLDASGIVETVSGTQAIVVCDTGIQQVKIANAEQQYVILACPMPANLQFTVQGGTGLLRAIAFNYNVFSTGTVLSTPAADGGGGGLNSPTPHYGVQVRP